MLQWTAVAAIPALFDLPREASAVLVAAVVFVPTVMIWRATRQKIVTDPVVVLGLVWVLAVTLPVLLPSVYHDPIWQRLSPDALDAAALWMYRGWAAFSLAYWGTRVFFTPRRMSRDIQARASAEVRLRRLIGLVGIIGSVFYLLHTGANAYTFVATEAGGESSTLLQIIHLLKTFSIGYVYLHFRAQGHETLEKLDRFLLYGVLAFQALIFIGVGSKGVAMALAAAWLMGRVAGLRRRSLLRETVLIAVSVAIVYGASYTVTAYREEVRSRALPRDPTMWESISFQVDAMQAAVSGVLQGRELGDTYNHYDASDIMDRFALVSAFALVLDLTGGEPPYENALTSFLAPVYAVVPRDLVGEKVHFMDSGDLARKFGGRQHEGWSITLPGSYYWAWGYVGIIPGMAALGAALSWLWIRETGAGSQSLIYRTVMIMSVIELLDVGTTFQAVVTNGVRIAMLLLLLQLVARTKWRQSTSPVSWAGRLLD